MYIYVHFSGKDDLLNFVYTAEMPIIHCLFVNSLGIGGFSVTNFTVVVTGVVGADTALLVAMDTPMSTGCSLAG